MNRILSQIQRGVFILLVLAGLGFGKTVSSQNKKPNIIFFIADDMTRKMCNFLPEGKGKNLTPNLDRLSEEGTILMGQHVASTVCTPSRFNCLTGKYASRAINPEFLNQSRENNNQRVVEWNTHIMPDKEAGYFTGAVGKNHVIEVKNHVRVPYNADFSDSNVKMKQLANYQKTVEAYKQCGFEYAGGLYYDNPIFNGPKALAVHNLDWTTEAALQFLDKKDNRPFFLYFATTIPHGPVDAKRAWNADRRVTPVGLLDEAPSCLPDKSTIPTRIKEAGLQVNDLTCNMLWLDDAVGALLTKLEEDGELDNTIIFFFNDHGQFGKGTVYQGAVSNPSVVWRSNGFKVGNICETSVSNVDFTPTILDMAGVDLQGHEFDGKSFVPVLEGEGGYENESLYFEIGYSRGVRKGKYKYISVRYPQWVHDITPEERVKILKKYNKKLLSRGKKPNNTDPNAPFGHVQIIPGGGDAEYYASKRYPNYSDIDQLYDLGADPKEKINLFNDPDYKMVVEEMQEELKKHIATIPGGFGEFK
jgi:arylsulfatase A-like enzyme